MATKAKKVIGTGNEVSKKRKTTIKTLPDNVVIDFEKGEFVIRIPFDPKPSSTGKSTILASTGGNCLAPELQYGEEDTKVMASVLIYAYEPKVKKEDEEE